MEGVHRSFRARNSIVALHKLQAEPGKKLVRPIIPHYYIHLILISVKWVHIEVKEGSIVTH